MEAVTLFEIAKYCGAEISDEHAGIKLTGVSTDTRTIAPGDLFIPLIGERFDGHDYIEKALNEGAAAFLSSRRAEFKGPVLNVPDTLTALHDIAKEYRKRFNVKAIGLTGSVGKTTTKEMIAAIIGAKYKTLKTKGNLNNEIGLPLTVLGLDETHEAAVFEMGMNHFGEISRLTKIAQPDTAVITNIGVMHIENLGSREGILKAKLEILGGLKPGGVVILNGDEPLLWSLRGRLDFKTIYFGIKNGDCDIRAYDIEGDAGSVSFKISTEPGGYTFKIPAPGMHNVYNALCAVICARRYGIEYSLIKEGFSNLADFGLRQKIYKTGGILIIDDTYNAGPDSMAAALSVLKSSDVPGRKIAVLGGMLELGEYSKKAHYGVGEYAAKCADLLFLYGGDTEYCAEGARENGMESKAVYIFSAHEDIANAVADEIRAGDAVLFKGSRGMEMEKVLNLVFK